MSIVIGRYCYRNWANLFIVGVDTAVFFWLERKTSTVTFKMLHGSDYVGMKPTFLLKWGFLTALFGGITIYTGLFIQSETVIDIFTTGYLMSTGIFSFSSALSSLIVGTGLISTASIRRGFFAIYLNIIIIVRTIFMGHYWIDFINAQPRLRTLLLILYYLVKVIQMVFLIRELYIAYTSFVKNKGLLWPDFKGKAAHSCRFCLSDEQVEPKQLKCGHPFCYACLFSWYATQKFCPLCRDETTPSPLVPELSDGKIPPPVFFCAL